MSPAEQAKFRIRVKTWLLHEGHSVSSLASLLGRHRSSVSMAINKGRNPRVVREIMEVVK
jgi:transposase